MLAVDLQLRTNRRHVDNTPCLRQQRDECFAHVIRAAVIYIEHLLNALRRVFRVGVHSSVVDEYIDVAIFVFDFFGQPLDILVLGYIQLRVLDRSRTSALETKVGTCSRCCVQLDILVCLQNEFANSETNASILFSILIR